MGHDFRALVNGVNGQVGGEHHYSSFKVRSRVRYVIAQQPGLWELAAETNSASWQVGGLAGLGAIAGAAALGLDFLNIPSFLSIGLASVVAGNVDSVPSGSAGSLYLVVPCRSGCTILPLLRRLAKGAEESRRRSPAEATSPVRARTHHTSHWLLRGGSHVLPASRGRATPSGAITESTSDSSGIRNARRN